MSPSAQTVPVPAALRSPAAAPPFDAVYREHVQAVARWAAANGMRFGVGAEKSAVLWMGRLLRSQQSTFTIGEHRTASR